jgi:predicted RNase H-related nuclease YkuK (DUF458 family)
MEHFRTERNKVILDLHSYIIDQLVDSTTEIHIGCDSQVYGPTIVYVLVIGFRRGIHGAHCIHKKIRKPRPPRSVCEDEQVLERLTEETYLTMELAQQLMEMPNVRISVVEFDFNAEEEHLSNKMKAMATGWSKGMGFNTRIKPEELLACKYADHVCRSNI